MGEFGNAYAAGHCSEIPCGKPIPVTDLWCADHRKTGPWLVNGKMLPWTYEQSEANHRARILDLISAGKSV